MLREEQETVINFDASDQMATLYTSDPVWMRKLDELCKKHPAAFECIETYKADGEVCGKKYKFFKRLVAVGNDIRRIESTLRRAGISSTSSTSNDSDEQFTVQESHVL